MTRKNRSLAFGFWMMIGGFLLFSCDSGSNSSATPDSGDTGSITFKANWVDNSSRDLTAGVSAQDEAATRRGAVDCGALGIEWVNAILYNNQNVKITNKEWECARHSGTIDGIPAPQDGVTIVLAGKNIDGNVTYRGEKGGLTVNKGPDNTAGEINVSSFIPPAAEPGSPPRTGTA